MIAALGAVVGQEIPFEETGQDRTGDIPDVVADCRLVREGRWKPATTIEQGLAAMTASRAGSGQLSSSREPPRPSPGVAAIERVREGGREREGMVPLDRNERLAPLPGWLIDELRAGLDSDLVTTYPATDRLQEELAAAVGLEGERLLLTPGSDAAHRALHHAYVEPGDEVVMLDPSYRMLRSTPRCSRAKPVAIPFAGDLTFDFHALLGAIGPATKLVTLPNPNQPTGTVLGEDAIAALLERTAAAGALLVIDEAYYPFSKQTALPLVTDDPQLVVTRTLSKAWGLAGLRLGYVAADPAVIANLFKVRSVYDANGLAIHVARLELAHPEVADDYVAEVEAGRALLAERCRAIGVGPLESPTNFMQLRVGALAAPDAVVEGFTSAATSSPGRTRLPAWRTASA